MIGKKLTILFALSLLFAVVLEGCSNIKVVPDHTITLQERSDKLPLDVGLYLSKEFNNSMILGQGGQPRSSIVGQHCLVGEALQSKVFESLSKVFRHVVIFNDKDKIPSHLERIINISLNPESCSTISDDGMVQSTTVIVALDTSIYDNKWSLKWRTKTIGNVKDTCPECLAYALLLPVGSFISISVERDFKSKIVNKSIVQALEQLNDQILTSGKTAILESGKTKTEMEDAAMPDKSPSQHDLEKTENELRKLEKSRSDGSITEEEYLKLKEEIINNF